MNREQTIAHLILVGAQPVHYGIYMGVLFSDGWFISPLQTRYVDRGKTYFIYDWPDISDSALEQACKFKANK